MDRGFRRRLILVHVSLVLVIGLIATTAALSLRETRDQAARSHAIDQQIALLDRLRAETRGLALGARKYLLSGALDDRQRVLSIVHAIKSRREVLQARATLEKGAILEADLEEYVTALVNAMDRRDDDALTRFARFEDELGRIRKPLASTFDEITSRERARRDALRTAQTLALGAQWAVLVAGGFGVLLALGAARSVQRKLDLLADASGVQPRDAALYGAGAALRRAPIDASVLVERAIKTNREAANERAVRLRHDVQQAVTVFADREHIRHALDALLQLAITDAQQGAELVVHVAAADGGVRFAIIHVGPCTDATTNQLALQLISRVVESYGGRIGIQTSSISRTYWFSLPTEPSLLT